MTHDHEEWSKAREGVLEAKAFEIDRVREVAKEKLLRKENALQSFLFRALKNKNSQSLIKLLKDDVGNETIDPYAMAKAILTHPLRKLLAK